MAERLNNNNDEDPVGSVSVRQLEVSVSERCVSPRAELKKVTDFA